MRVPSNDPCGPTGPSSCCIISSAPPLDARRRQHSLCCPKQRRRHCPTLSAVSPESSAFPLYPETQSGGSSSLSWTNRIAWYLASLASKQLTPLLSWIYKYHDILKRVAVTVAMLAIMRAGMFIPLPGVDMAHLQAPTLDTEGKSGHIHPHPSAS